MARRYVAVAVVLVAGAVLATGAIDLRFTYDAEKDALADLQGEQAAAAADRVDRFIGEVDRQLASTVGGARDVTQRRDDFRRILFQVPAITDLRHLDRDGRERVVVSRLEPDALDGAVDRSTDDAFTAPEPDLPFYGPVEFRDGTEPHLVIAHRTDDGGAVLADVNLALVQDVVASIDVGEQGEAFAVDRDGVLVAHPDLTLVLGRQDLSSLAHVRRAVESRSGNGVSARDLDGERVLASFRTIDHLGWAVFVQQPLGVAFDRVEDGIVRTGVLLSVAVALAGLAAFVLGRRMVRPLDALQQGAAQIGAGALDHRIEVHSGDELEAVADEFNRMSDRLRSSLEELRDSRARIVGAADDARRRLERDLHDGAQQHLVAVAMKLRLARRAADDASPVAPMLDELHDDVQRAVAELRSLAHGIFPPLLASGGLQIALRTAATMASLPVSADVALPGDARFPQDVEATVYFCCLEALQNAAKHAGDGASARIHVWQDGGRLRFSVADDGVGFDADAAAPGRGLVNMADRVGALGGRIDITASPGAGTVVQGEVPI